MKPIARVNRVLAAGMAEVVTRDGFERSKAEARTWLRRGDHGIDFVWSQVLSEALLDWRSFRLEPVVRVEALAAVLGSADASEPPLLGDAVPAHLFHFLTGPSPSGEWEVFDDCDMEAVIASIAAAVQTQALPWLDRFHSYAGTIENLRARHHFGLAARLAAHNGDAEACADLYRLEVDWIVGRRSPFDDHDRRLEVVASLTSFAEELGMQPEDYDDMLPRPATSADLHRLLIADLDEGQFTIVGDAGTIAVDADCVDRVNALLTEGGIDPTKVQIWRRVLSVPEMVKMSRAVNQLLQRWRSENREVWGTVTAGEGGVHVHASGLTDEDEQRIRSIVPPEALTIGPCSHSWAKEQRYRLQFPMP